MSDIIKETEVACSYANASAELLHVGYAELVNQVINAAKSQGVQLLAENALEGGIYDADALQRMLQNSKHFDR